MSFGKAKENEGADKGMLSALNLSAQPSSAASSKVEAFLGQGSKVVGTLTFSGPVQIDGNVEGEVHAKDKLIIGETAVVNAKVIGVDVLVMGTVNGDVSGTKRLSLKKPARVTGNISSSNLSIEEGVVFEGKCSMSNVTSIADRKIASTTVTEKLGASIS